MSTPLQRWRVPLGFAAAVVLVLAAHPHRLSLLLGLPVGALGVALRASAAGHIRKNDALAVAGPYRYTRNPLYLGSALIAVGLVIAADYWLLALLAGAMFVGVYLPVIAAEEEYLAGRFGPAFAEYKALVPRLLPRLPRRRPADLPGGGFSLALYRRHREYQALLGFLALFALLVAKSLAQAPAPPGPAPSSQREQLHYLAHWRVLPAGNASLTFGPAPAGAGQATEIHFDADATGLVSFFYPVRDRMQTLYDSRSHCTTAVDNDTLEGRRHRLTHIRFNPALGQLVLDEVDPSRQPPQPKHQIKPIPGCVLDLLGALDFARSQPLRVGDVYRFPVNEGGATSDVKLTVELRETVETPAGSFVCVRAEPTLFDRSVFQHPGRMWVWFSDDARHLPVQIEAKVSWGTITAQLASQ